MTAPRQDLEVACREWLEEWNRRRGDETWFPQAELRLFVERLIGLAVRDERAACAMVADDRANSLAEWMRTLPLHSEERKDKSLRAGELYGISKAIRARGDSQGAPTPQASEPLWYCKAHNHIWCKPCGWKPAVAPQASEEQERADHEYEDCAVGADVFGCHAIVGGKVCKRERSEHVGAAPGPARGGRR